MARLSERDLAAAMERLPGWKLDGKALCKTFDRQSFRAAMSFVNTVAEAAERADHHPDILIQYSKVTLRLWTHSEGGVTEKDVALARQIETVSTPEPP